MEAPRRLRFEDAEYPDRLRSLRAPPVAIWIAGEIIPATTIAIVGTRRPDPEAEAFAAQLAGAVVRAGGVVVSGGALGIDAAAHRGAIARGGRTWCVAPNGHLFVSPRSHEALFEEAVAKGGAMIWPFGPRRPSHIPNYFHRNSVLAALADAVVIVQAGCPSGALNAARWARELGRPLWVVPGPPWMERFAGCRSEIDRGARILTSIPRLLAAVGLGAGSTEPLPFPPVPAGASPEQRAVLEVLSNAAIHMDEVVARSSLPMTTVAPLLLTLALENVVVEGPEGFFRRASGG